MAKKKASTTAKQRGRQRKIPTPVDSEKPSSKRRIEEAPIMEGTEVHFIKPVIEVSGKKSTQQIKIPIDVGKNTFKIEPKITTDHCSMNNPKENEAMLSGLMVRIHKAINFALERRRAIYDATGANPPDTIEFPENEGSGNVINLSLKDSN